VADPEHAALPTYALQNRGAGFTLQEGPPNQLTRGKRPFHTPTPASSPVIAPIRRFSVMGGHVQPQGHVRTIVNTIDYGLNPQASLDAPRWHWERSHEVTTVQERGSFGRGQIAVRHLR
jgi:gamma-glutamyltranspeptidase / glutathione hydrolase